MRTREKLAWAAGFFEGEGTVRLTIGKPGISIGNSDATMLEAFREAVGLGKIYGPYRPSGSTKPFYQYWVSDFEGMQAVVGMLWHWLSARRRAQFATLLHQISRRNPHGDRA